MGKFWITVNGVRKRTKAGIHHELVKFQSSEKAKKDRSARNSARRKAVKSGKAHKGDNKDVHHVSGNPRSSKTTVISRKSNRGKSEHSRKRGSKRNKRTWGK